MAYVAVSQDLRNRVKTKIHKMRDAEIASELPELGKTFAIDASYLFNFGCWGKDNMHLLTAIPRDWLCQEKSNYVVISGQADVEGEVQDVAKSLSFTSMTNAYRRPSTDYWNKSSSTVLLEELLEMPSTTPGRDEALKRWNDAVTEEGIKKRWAKVELDILAFLDKVKSLNEAVKLFPGIKLYVDMDDIERLERKVQRGAREELVVNIDMDALTASAVVAQLNGGV